MVTTAEDANATDGYFPHAAKTIMRSVWRAPPKYLDHFLEQGLNPNLTWSNNHDIQSLLGLAISSENTQAIEQLLEAGADVELDRGRHGRERSPLQSAVSIRYSEAVRLLIEHGADVNRVTNQPGGVPLLTAAGFGDLSITKQLIDAGADIEYAQRRPYEVWPLVSAARRGHDEVVAVLIKAGANVNRQSIDTGSTALHAAVHAKSEATIELLLKAGAIPTIEGNYGSSPYEIAKRKGLEHLFIEQ